MKKLFLLVCAVLALVACKDRLEPESDTPNTPATANQQPSSYESQKSGDTFMQHIANPGATNFYASHYASFTPSVSAGVVNGLNYVELGHNTKHAWYYGSDNTRILNRTDGTSTDASATFGMENYAYTVPDTNDFHTWQIKNVPASVYHSVFENMSNATLAQRAADSLNAVNAKAAFTEGVSGGIKEGYGSWNANGDHFNLLSKGSKAGFLHYSDFGFKQGPTPVQYASEKYETVPYIGGVEANQMQAPPSMRTKYYGTAYVCVMPTEDPLSPGARGGLVGTGLEIFATDSGMSTYSYGVEADTLRMPFNGWYTVGVIKRHSDDRITLIFDGYPIVTSFDEGMWGTRWNQPDLINAPRTIMPNGLKYSLFSSEADDYSVYVSISDPLFYGENQNEATGLDNVYCGTPRKSKADNNPSIPGEVVICGEYKEYKLDGVSTKGVEISFIYGARKTYKDY